MHDFRDTFNVFDYAGFDLRHQRSSSLNVQHRYRLLHDDYSPKPAFGVYRDLVGDLSRRGR